MTVINPPTHAPTSGPAKRAGRGTPADGRESGFTVVELLIVIGIAALLASILILGIRQISESFALRQAASMVSVEIRNAQAGGLSNGVDYVLEFDTSTSGGPPGSLIVFRPGVAVTGAVSVTSNGESDTRSVTVVGIKDAKMVSATVFLNGMTVIDIDSVGFDWILEAETPTPNLCCTISVKQGSTTLTTIAPSKPSAILPWTTIRTVRAPELPQQVRMDSAGTTLPLCSSLGAPWTASTNHCLRFRPLGFPDQAGELLLCSGARVPARIVVSAGTGRVSVDRVGACP